MATNNIQHPAAVKVSSAPISVTQMTQAEREKFYADLRSRIATSPLTVKCPPGVTAYWARKNDEQELGRLDIMGFSIVRELDPSKPRFKAHGLKADGTYQLGDVILLEIPTDVYNFYLEENAKRSRMMVEGARENFRSQAAEQNVPTFEVKRDK